MLTGILKLSVGLLLVSGAGVIGARTLGGWLPPNQELTFGSLRSDRQAAMMVGIYALDMGRNLFAPLVADHFENNSPAWSPDGQRLAFVSTRTAGSPKIFLMDANGGTIRRLTDSIHKEDAPAWSPDSKWLTMWLENRGAAFEVNKVTGLYLMDMQTREMRQIISGKVEDVMRSAWSPSGQQIAFTSQGKLYLTDTNGTAPRSLVAVQVDNFSAPSWSPDGQQIVFQALAPKSGPQLYTVNVDGSDLRQLTAAPGSNAHPIWSPDGQWLAFSSFRDGNDELYLMARNGTQLRRLTWNEDSDYRPVWRP